MRNWRDMDRAEVEAIASGRTLPSGRLGVEEVGSARAELVRRDQEYAEQQEKIRQEFDAALAGENREAARQVAQMLSEAAKEVSERQIRIGRQAVRAAVAAAIAAGAAAIAAIAQVVISAVK